MNIHLSSIARPGWCPLQAVPKAVPKAVPVFVPPIERGDRVDLTSVCQDKGEYRPHSYVNPKSSDQQPAVPRSSPLLEPSDKPQLLEGLSEEDRRLVEARLNRLSPACLRVLSANQLKLSVYSFVETLKLGANGVFETSCKKGSGEIAGQAIRVGRMALPGGILAALKRSSSLGWIGAALGGAGLALATLSGPLGWALAAGAVGLGVLPTIERLHATNGGTLEHEISHALDQAVGLQGAHTLPLDDQGVRRPVNYSETSPEVQACYQEAKRHGFMSEVAAESVKEYFAEAGSAYLNDEPERPLNRNLLKKSDPRMFAVMERFFEGEVPALALRLGSLRG